MPLARSSPEPLTLRGARNILPRVAVFGACGSDPTFDNDVSCEGRVLVVSWLGFQLEVSALRRQG